MLWVGLNLLFYDTLFCRFYYNIHQKFGNAYGNNIETLYSTIYRMKMELQVEIEKIEEQIYGVVFQ